MTTVHKYFQQYKTYMQYLLPDNFKGTLPKIVMSIIYLVVQKLIMKTYLL